MRCTVVARMAIRRLRADEVVLIAAQLGEPVTSLVCAGFADQCNAVGGALVILVKARTVIETGFVGPLPRRTIGLVQSDPKVIPRSSEF